MTATTKWDKRIGPIILLAAKKKPHGLLENYSCLLMYFQSPLIAYASKVIHAASVRLRCQ